MEFFLHRIIIIFLLGSIITLSAAPINKIYDVQSGMVEYNISGGGNFTNELNITFSGTSQLQFKDWGKVSLIEKRLVVLTDGTLHHIEETHTLEKNLNKKQFNVDFKTKKILEHALTKGSIPKNITKGLHFTKEVRIANVPCKMWEAKGIKKCLYKGIPLLESYRVLNTVYVKQATFISLDTNRSKATCVLPDYPIYPMALITHSVKTKNKKTPKLFFRHFIEVFSELQQYTQEHNLTADTLPIKKKTYFMHKLGKNIFQTQKRLLPQVLRSMKESRVCLQKSQTSISAKCCIIDLNQLEEDFFKSRRYKIDDWNSQSAIQFLNQLDENILNLERKMKCIRSAKHIDDLSGCMQ